MSAPSAQPTQFPDCSSNGRPLPFRNFGEYAEAFSIVCQTIADKVPSIRENFVIKGTGPIATQHLRHRLSWDLDLITTEAFAKPGPLVNKLRKAFGYNVSLLGDDTAFYQGNIRLPGLPPINLDIFSGYENVSAKVLERNKELGSIPFIGLNGYAAIKVLTVQDRDDPKDIYDLAACASHPLCATYTKERISKSLNLLELGKLATMSESLNPEEFDPGIPGFQVLKDLDHKEFTAFASERLAYKKSIDLKRQEMRRLDRAERDLGFSY